MFLPHKCAMNNCQQQSLETGKAQRRLENVRESVIADGGLACCPQPWKGHLEEAFAAIDWLQMRISHYETKLSLTNSESIEFPVAKRSRNSDSNLDMPSSCFRRSSFNLVFRSLADSIEAWEAAGDTKTRHLLPKFNIVATVVKWGVPNQTKGMVTVFDFSTALSCCQGSDCHVLATISDNVSEGDIVHPNETCTLQKIQCLMTLKKVSEVDLDVGIFHISTSQFCQEIFSKRAYPACTICFVFNSKTCIEFLQRCN